MDNDNLDIAKTKTAQYYYRGLKNKKRIEEAIPPEALDRIHISCRKAKVAMENAIALFEEFGLPPEIKYEDGDGVTLHVYSQDYTPVPEKLPRLPAFLRKSRKVNWKPRRKT